MYDMEERQWMNDEDYKKGLKSCIIVDFLINIGSKDNK